MNLTNQLSEIEVNYSTKIKKSDMPKVVTSHDAYKCFKHIWSDRIQFVEESILLLLNRANRALGYVKLSSGGTTGTVVDIKLIFAIALKTNASSIILAHNHLSGNLRPSDADQNLTKELSASSKILNLPLLDHLILTDEGYYSMSDEGLLI